MASERIGSAANLQSEGARSGFFTTHWTMVVRAAGADLAGSAAALDALCRTYWYPIYCFARQHGGKPEDAEELTQGFFADLLARGALARADAARGHFRTFLLCSFRNYCSHERERGAARKRGGGREFISLEEMETAGARFGAEAPSTESAERLYERAWAIHLLDQAIASVRAEYAAIGKSSLFEELEGVIHGGGDPEGYRAIAARMGSNPGTIKVAAFRLRRRIGLEIRACVAQTVDGDGGVDQEVQHLIAAVQGPLTNLFS